MDGDLAASLMRRERKIGGAQVNAANLEVETRGLSDGVLDIQQALGLGAVSGPEAALLARWSYSEVSKRSREGTSAMLLSY